MKFDGYLICADHDGTVAEGGEILPENIKAIEYFQQNGGIYTVATGRRHDFIIERYNNIIKPHVPAIIGNGTMLYDITDNKIIYRDFMSCDDYYAMFDAFYHADGANNLRIELESETLWFNVNETDIKTIEQWLAGREISKFVLDFNEESKTLELQHYLAEKYGTVYKIVRAWPTGLEFFSKTAGKGECIEPIKNILLDKLGINIHTVIGMGDFENDLSLIQLADIGVAMGNALGSLKTQADLVAESCASGGAAKYIYSL